MKKLESLEEKKPASSINFWGLNVIFTDEPLWYKKFIVCFITFLLIVAMLLIGVTFWLGYWQLPLLGFIRLAALLLKADRNKNE